MKKNLTWQIAWGIVYGFLILSLIIWIITALGQFVYGNDTIDCDSTWYNQCSSK
jgi:hypothetical protein